MSDQIVRAITDDGLVQAAAISQFGGLRAGLGLANRDIGEGHGGHPSDGNWSRDLVVTANVTVN